MPIRDILIAVTILALVPVSFFRPWIGVLIWSWIAYMAPHKLAWGFAQSLPVAMLIGGATIAGFLFIKDRKPLPRILGVWLFLLLGIHFTITTFFAINPDLAWGKWNWVSKSLLITFVTMWLFQDRSRLRALFMMIALSLGYYGLKGGLWVLRTGGEYRVWGPVDTFFGDNNTLGLALCMAVPLLLGLSREEPRQWLRVVLRTTFGFSVIAILFTHSRGAFLALTVILVMLIWRSPWRLRFATVVVVTSLLALPFIPLNLEQRIQSIQDYQQDPSAIGRLQAWTTGYYLALDHPFLGGGFRAFNVKPVWDRYYPGEYLAFRDSHSLYFEVLGEHGFLGMGLYLMLLVVTFVNLGRIRKRWQAHPEHGWLSRYADMTQLALYPFLVAGAFLGVAYFDLYFHLVAIGVILKALSDQTERSVIVAATLAARTIPAGPRAFARPTRLG